jgi:asparagine synthase (glutamine-hydrolysing)
LPQLVKHYGEPYADPSAVPSFYVCRSARNHVTVALNGDGGDELLGGYSRYELTGFQMRYSSFLGNLVTPSLAAKLGPELFLKTNSMIKKTASVLLLEILRPELKSLTMYGYFFNKRARKRLLTERFDIDFLDKWYVNSFQQACNKASNPIDRMLYVDNKNYLPGDLLIKMDIASMHCGLEARSPFLDHHLIEFCASLPVHLKSKNREGKYLLKKLAERYFPKEFVYREKMGFGIPLFKWLEEPLKELLLDVLHSSDLMEEFDKKEIENQLKPFLNGHDYTAPRLWCLFMYGLWKKECYLA